MALIITSEIATNGGVTSQGYLNIQKLSLSKDIAVDIWVNLYLSESTRLDYPEKKVISMQVPKRFGIANEGSPDALSLLGSETIYKFAYSEIKHVLESRGLVVEDSL